MVVKFNIKGYKVQNHIDTLYSQFHTIYIYKLVKRERDILFYCVY